MISHSSEDFKKDLGPGRSGFKSMQFYYKNLEKWWDYLKKFPTGTEKGCNMYLLHILAFVKLEKG